MKGHGGTVSEAHHHPVTSTEDRPINDAGLKSAPLVRGHTRGYQGGRLGPVNLVPTVGTDAPTE